MLYKYLRCEIGISVLKDQVVRFTQPGALNDPFEMRPAVVGYDSPEAMDKQLEDIRPLALQEAYAAKSLTYRDRVTFEGFRRSTTGLWASIKEVMKQNAALDALEFWDRSLYLLDRLVGILCLAEHRDSLLMWSHYADQHQGVAIGLDSSHGFFNQTPVPEVPQFGKLHRVRYALDRPVCNLMDLKEFSLLLVKSAEWGYEHEHRMLLPLEGATRPRKKGDEFPIALFALPSDAIAEVVLGARMTDVNRGSILDILRTTAGYKHVRVYQARPAARRFELEVEEIGI
ncbi:MAG: DUF2971 domain-containing protein [Candidatus Eisenbacteria sp.]|nr:DUF2971 domain-containing protein [Candidatus Eisenbacteria bacterium]